MMTAEVTYLACVTILTLLMRIPWMVEKVRLRGLDRVTGYPSDSEPLNGWSHRAWVAHEDAVQNLVVFAGLVLVLHLADESTVWTRSAAAIYFWARLGHAVVYIAGVPRLKTILFVVAYLAQLVLAATAVGVLMR